MLVGLVGRDTTWGASAATWWTDAWRATRVVAQPARWMGCRGRRGGDKGGAAQVEAAGSCLPLSLGSQQAALRAPAPWDLNSLRCILRRRGVPACQDPAAKKRRCLGEAAWNLQRGRGDCRLPGHFHSVRTLLTVTFIFKGPYDILFEKTEIKFRA